MANEYAVNRDDLTAVADAIRTKGGTSAPLAFPGGFVDAVEAIQAGGGGGDDSMWLSVLNRSAVEFVNDNITEIYAARLFEYCDKLTTVSIPNLKTAWISAAKGFNYGFNQCVSLKTVNLPSLETMPMSLFANCTSLEEIVLPSLKTFSNNQNFYKCSGLRRVDLARKNTGGNKSLMQQQFVDCVNFDTLILRAEDGIWALANANVFNGTPFASGGSGGTVYCPQALIEQYQTATNWSTLYAAGTCTFAAIEGSEYE